jgi:hypothetical protein
MKGFVVNREILKARGGAWGRWWLLSDRPFPVENGFRWYGFGFVGPIELWANEGLDERWYGGLVELEA